jgi:hypothetical protein
MLGLGLKISRVVGKGGGYVSKLVSAYVKRVTDDGGVVEAKSCVKAAFKELGAEPIIPFDADYQAVLNYATTQGYSLPSASQQILQNQLVIDLKTGGIWSKLDTFGVFATDGDSDFALIDWIRLSDYTAVNSPTFTTNQGFTGDGTSSYIDTNFNPSTSGVNYTLDDASRYFFPHALVGGTYRMDGTTNTRQNNMIRSNITEQRINCGLNTLLTAFDYSAVINPKSIHRTSSSSVDLFNGTVGTTGVQTSTSIFNSNQFIFRSGAAYSEGTVSAYAMGASLVAENTDFVNAYNTYITSI